MPIAAKTHQELLQAAAHLLDWGVVGIDIPCATLLARAQQHRLTRAADTAYRACVKAHYGGPNSMNRLWEDVLRRARVGALEMSDVGQSRLTRALAGTRSDLTEIMSMIDVGTSCVGAARTDRLRGAAEELIRRADAPWPARTLASLTLPAAPSVSADSAVLAWYSLVEMCVLPEPDDPGGPVPAERAEVARTALERGIACDRAYWNSGMRGRTGSPPREAASGPGTWVTLSAVLAAAEQAPDPVAAAREWAGAHDEWLTPRDEPLIATRIVRTLFENGRMADALRALEVACRQEEEPSPELVDTAVGMCAALLALGDREGAERALPPSVRVHAGRPDGRNGPRFDPEFALALRQALVDPQLGLSALRRVWYATYSEDAPDTATGWFVAGALARCLRESGAEAEAGIVAALSRRMLDDPGNEQQQRMRSLLAVPGRIEAEEQTERDRERLHGLLDELEGLLLRAPQLASDPRLARELGGIARVARRARVLFRPVRTFVLDEPFAGSRQEQ